MMKAIDMKLAALNITMPRIPENTTVARSPIVPAK
jgi:hypothetical protein